MPPDLPRLLTPEEADAALTLPPGTLAAEIAAGRIGVVTVPGTAPRLSPELLAAWILARTTPAPGPPCPASAPTVQARTGRPSPPPAAAAVPAPAPGWSGASGGPGTTSAGPRAAEPGNSAQVRQTLIALRQPSPGSTRKRGKSARSRSPDQLELFPGSPLPKR